MLKVIVIDDGVHAGALSRTLSEAGVHIMATVRPDKNLAAEIARLSPDVVLIDADAPGRDTLEEVCVASEHSALPVVMFTADGNRATIRRALAAGVAAYVVGEVPASRIQSLMDVAIERCSIERARREELCAVREKLAERQWVDKAKGLLMRLRDVSEDEAYRMLRERAMQSQRRLGDVARETVEMAQFLGNS